MIAVDLVRAVEEFSRRTGESFESIGKRAGFSRGYVSKLLRAVAADPMHTLDTQTVERVCVAVGYAIRIERKDEER